MSTDREVAIRTRPATQIEKIVFGSTLAITLIFGIFCIGRIWRFRGVYPVAQRQLYPLLISSVAGILGGSLYQLGTAAKEHLHCFSYLLVGNFFTNVVSVVYLIRVVRLYYFVRFSSGAAEVADNRNPTTKTNPLPKHILPAHSKALLSKWNLAIGVLSAFLVLVPSIVYVLAFASTAGSVSVNLGAIECDVAYTKTLGTIYLNNVTIFLIAAVAYWKIWAFKDNFHIIEEFKKLTRLGLLVAVQSGATTLLLYLLPDVRLVFTPEILIYPTLVIGICKVSLLDVVKIAENHIVLSTNSMSAKTQKSVSVHQEMRTALTNALENSEMFERLQNFLVKEFSVETVLFLRAVLDFRTKEGDKAYEFAMYIWKTYCVHNAPLAINISSECRTDLSNVFNLTPEELKQYDVRLKACFDQAYKEVFELVLRDSFPRFILQSELTAQVLEHTTMTTASLHPEDDTPSPSSEIPQALA
jgi:hypothetical protein